MAGSAIGSLLVVLGLALVGLVILPGTGLAQSTPDTGQAPDVPKPLGSLKSVPLQTPPNLSDFVQDKTAAVALGKALFWDQQMGSDGVTACATCHYQAGADVRSKNVISPGVNGGSTDWFGKGPNYQLTLNDYPFHRVLDPNDTTSLLVGDNNDITGSQGVFDRTFNLPGMPGVLTKGVDACDSAQDPVFNVGGLNTRRVTGRNAPSVVNAAYNFRNFWDGRANNNFNGVNPFGDRDPGAAIFKASNPAADPQPLHVSIPFSSLASQAVGPPGSGFEMSCGGRIFPNMGRKMLTAVPLGQQTVDPTDSVLGSMVNPGAKNGAMGLKTTYIEMIKKAFKPEYWNSVKPVTIGGSSPVTPSLLMSDLIKIIAPGKVVPATADLQRKDQVQIPTNQYTQMEANFSLFWGLAIQMYEDTLIANDSPVDQYFDGKPNVLTAEQLDGMAVFENQGRCINCHGGPETTNASVSKVTSARLEHMKMGDASVAVYDDGFYNIGVRPTSEDPGVGGKDPFGNPLSETGLCQLMLKSSGGNNCPSEVRNMVARPNEGLAGAQLQPNDRTAVNGNFKAPGLRDVELTGPYFHNGGQATLRQVVDFYSRGGDFGDVNAHDLDPDIGGPTPIALSETEKNDLVAFLIGLTDERVRWEKAPFDHPSLCIPNGHPGSTTSVTADSKNPGQATDDMTGRCLPAVGAKGRTTAQGPVVPFLANAKDPNLSTFQYQPGPVNSQTIKAGTDSTQIDPRGTTSALFAPPPSGGAAPPATLYAWGDTSPQGMVLVGGHLFVADHVMGLCQLDPAPDTLHAADASVCDPNGVVGSPGQPVFDAAHNYVYVPDNSRKSAGVWRLTYHSDTDKIDSPVPLDASLAGIKADALALSPDGSTLFVGSLTDGGIRRINGLLNADTRTETVDIIAHTNDGRGINGSMALLGNDLYLPENLGLSVIRNVQSCPVEGCFPQLLSIPGVTFANAVTTDGADKVYVATNLPAAAPPTPGLAGAPTQAEIYRYSASAGAADLFVTAGMDPSGPAATEDCGVHKPTTDTSTPVATCTRPADPWTRPGQPTALFFVLGMYYDPGSSTLYIGDDPLAGQRFGTGHVWSVNAPR